ncbi:MAG: hypothetical protein IKZ61_07155, partial [Prevotella sp.]|nr:hypothetical protein [Prevotella sp.]
RLGELGLFSLGINTKPAPSAREFSAAQNVKSVHLLVRNTKTWSNAELRKKCSISELEKNAIAEEVTPAP